MKWAVTADLHFGMYDRHSQPLSDGRSSRLKAVADCWLWMCQKANERGCQGIIVIGDVFESRDSIEVPVIHQVCASFKEAHDMGFEIIVVAGNHDSYLRNPMMVSLTAIEAYATVVREPLVRDGFGFVPWTDDQDQYRRWVEKTRSASILFSHVLLDESGFESGISIEEKTFKSFDHCFFGDVHEPKKLAAYSEYVGAPLQHTYRDAGSDKRGFTVLDFRKKSGRIRTERVTNDMSPRFHVLDDKNKETESINDGDYVRVRTDDVSVEDIEADATIEKEAASDVQDMKPRLEISTAEPHRKVLQKYLKHAGVKKRKRYIDTGLQLLEEVSR